MMPLKKKVIRFTIVLLSISLLLLLLPPFLSKSHPVKSKLLVIEGWISGEALTQAAKEIRKNKYSLIITTGGPTPENVEMLYNGTLEINCAVARNPKDKYIFVNAFGTFGGKISAHFKIVLNNLEIGESFVKNKLSAYQFKIPDSIKSIHTIKIIFDNDFFESKTDDRNLFIKSIVIGKLELFARNSENYLVSNNLKTPVYSDFANRAAYELRRLCIDSTKLIPVPTPEVKTERTLTSARAFAMWVNNQKITVENFNLFSEGVHSRRSWLVYRYVLGKNKQIGIIAAIDPTFKKYWWTSGANIYKLLREFMGNLYFQLALLTHIF